MNEESPNEQKQDNVDVSYQKTTAPFFQVKNDLLESFKNASFYFREANVAALKKMMKPELVARFITYTEDVYLNLRPNLLKNNYKLKTDHTKLKEMDNYMGKDFLTLIKDLNSSVGKQFETLLLFNDYLSDLILLADECGLRNLDKEKKDFTPEHVTEEFLFMRYGL